jgi:uncharacterized phage protein (TIGR01671 family)
METIEIRTYDKLKNKMIFGPTDENPNSSWVMVLSQSNNLPLMMYSTFNDKKGVKIFEGDILDNGTGEFKGVVEFKNGCFVHRNSPLGYFVEDGEVQDNRTDPDDKITLQVSEPKYWAYVIGNIYQNPELS